MKSILVVSSEDWEGTVWDSKQFFLKNMLKSNLLESPFKKQMKAGAGAKSGILNPSKAYIFFSISSIC